LTATGVERLTVAPLVLFAAGHLKRDIPAAVAGALRGKAIDWRQSPHLGCHEKIVELSGRRFREALAGRPQVPASDTLLLLIGRGSGDDSATAEMERFATLRQREAEVAQIEVGFLAVARPSFAEALEHAAASGYQRIVVQPHLLFQGELSEVIGEQLSDRARRDSQHEWVLADHLGPDATVAEAAVDLAPNWNPPTI
jgi:sirohydrochlorin cobaltochelatase